VPARGWAGVDCSRPHGAGASARYPASVSTATEAAGPLRLIDGWDVAHAAAAVVSRHGVLARYGDTGRRYRWASVSKLCTALAVLVACEEGVTSLDSPAGPPGSTVRHLLAHASGLGFRDALRPLARPGRRRIYSNAGYEVLAEHVERSSGLPFAVYLAESVLQPAGMDGVELEGSPAAGLDGTLEDLVALAAQLLDPAVVAPESLRLARSVAFEGLAGVVPGFGRQAPCDWGLGPEVRGEKRPHWTGSRNSPGTFGHFGQAGTFLWVDPALGLACAVLTDRPFGPWARLAWPQLSDEVLELSTAGAWAGGNLASR
jgi:CubicO group peptidase (beta-lactamase class C family)